MSSDDTEDTKDKQVIVMPEMKHTERKSGCMQYLGCLAKTCLVALLIAAPIALVWWWHPWHYESKRVALEGACPEGHRGEKHVDYLVVLGVRVNESGSATICVPVESGGLE